MRSARIEPLTPPYSPSTESMLAKWMPPGAEVEPLTLFRVLAVHEELAGRMRPLGAGLLGHGLLDPREREIVLLRTCARAGAEYEWGVHAVAFARPLGLDDEQIEATVTGGADAGCWSPRERLLVALADELHETAGVSDALWARLEREWEPPELIELVVLAGWYRLLSGVINAAGLPREPWAERFPA